MPSALPAPPKRRGAPSAAATNHARSGTGSIMNWSAGKSTMAAYDTRIKWNMIILVSQLLLAQIGVWGLFRKLVDSLVGETAGWIFDWLVVLIPAVNVAEALWQRANRPTPAVANEPPNPSASPAQRRIQSLSTTVPTSVLNSPLPRALDSSRNDTPTKRRESHVLDLTLPHGFTPDSSMVSGFSSPSPSVQARARMQKSAAASSGPVRVPDLFDSRASSLEPGDAPPGSGNAMTASRSRRREGANSREPSPFSISSLPVKKAPKTGRALDSSSLRGLVS